MIGGILSLDMIKDKPLKERFFMCMYCAKAQSKFDAKASEIISQRQRELHGFFEDWDENEVSRIKSFNESMKAEIGTYCTLKMLYKSEFDDIEAMETIIDKMAEEIADEMLVKFGWKEKGADNVHTMR